MAKPPTKLTAKQELFCQEYLIDLNATQAAIRAGYSEKTAQRMGSENLSKPLLSGKIEELKSQRADTVAVDAKYVLNRLVEIDSLDVIDILNEDGSMKPIIKWPKSWRTSITGIDVQEMMSGDIATVIKKIKWPDKLKNLELLGRHVNIGAWNKEEDKGPVDELADSISKLIDRLPG